jgi:hypothetical protein
MEQGKIGKRSAAADGSKSKQESGPAHSKKAANERKKEKQAHSKSNSVDPSPQKKKVVAPHAQGPKHAAAPPTPTPVTLPQDPQTGPHGQKNGGGSLPHPKIEDMNVQYKLNVLTNNGGMLRVADLRAQLQPGQPPVAERKFVMPDKLPPESQKAFKPIR